MVQRVTRLQVRLEPVEAEHSEDLAWLADQLREELLGLDVDAVEAVRGGEAPAGTRGGEWAVVGALLVSFAGQVGSLATVVDTVRGWLRRAGDRSVKLVLDGDVLEVTGVSSRQQEQLIQAWLARHDDVGEAPDLPASGSTGG